MNLHLGEPRAWSLLGLVPLLALIWWRSRVYMTTRSRWTLLGLRSLTVLLLVVALADPRLPRHERGTGQGVLLTLDVSDSLGIETAREILRELRERWRDWATALGPGGKLRLALLSEDLTPVPPEVLEGPGAPDEEDLRALLEEAREGRSKRATDIARALAHAREFFSPTDTPRLVLLSDGLSNLGNLEEEVLAAKLRGLEVHGLELAPLEEDPLYLESFQVPDQVFTGDEYHLSALVVSERPGSVRLTLRQSGTIVHRQTLNVVEGETRWTHELQAGAVGALGLELAIEPIDVPDLHPENNLYSAFTRVRQMPEVLFASRREDSRLALLQALDASRLKYQRTRFPSVPSEPGALRRFSAVVLDSPASQDLTPAQQDALLRYVKLEGGGLILLGGKDTLARGTWMRDTLEEALPVYLVPSTQSTSFALYLLLDSSSSMAGPPMAQAKFAAKRIISLMAGRSLGVAHFAHDVTVAVPLQEVGENKFRVAKDIDQIAANGGTAFSPGLELALRELKKYGAAENHILLLSDGQPGDEILIRRLYPVFLHEKVKVSTVGIGQQVNSALLADIARNCDGRFYDVDDLTELVEIFEKEVERLIGPPFEETRFVPRVIRSHYLARNLPPDPLPPLHGYLGTTLKGGAEAPLVNQYGDPLLAVWRCGLGKSAIWASDVHGPWGKDWRTWKQGFSPFWEGVLKAIVRSEVSDYKLSLQLRGRDIRVVVDGVDRDGRTLNGEKLRLRVQVPGGTSRPPLLLPQTQEGRYEGHFMAERRGFYAVSLERLGEEGWKSVNESGVALGYDPEYHPTAGGGVLLQHLASATGGSLLTDLEDIPLLLAEEVEGQREEVLRLWPPFAILALLVFFLEVALRRLGFFHVSELGQLEGGADQGALAYQHIAERYLKMAEDLDLSGDREQAQRYYLKARSFFLKANAEDKASRTWEKYRQLERR